MENLILVEGRSLCEGEKVEVYYNLHKGGFSIKSLDKRNIDKGRVVAYAPSLTITEATFHVSESRLKSILKRQVREVYAVVRGYYQGVPVQLNNAQEVYINPYKAPYFTLKETNQIIDAAGTVIFYEKACAIK
jgi:hypothetical protein